MIGQIIVTGDAVPSSRAVVVEHSASLKPATARHEHGG
jgi:hypothetical protein